MSRTLTVSDLENIALGACLFGGGGGGPISGAQPLIDYMSTQGLSPTLWAIDELPGTLAAGVVAGIGAPDAAVHGPAFTEAPQQAFKQLATTCGSDLQAVLPGETGAMNSIIPALVAAQLGLALVDVDSAGRALPTLDLAAYNLATAPNPLILTNQTADPSSSVQAILNTPTPQGVDALVRGLVTASAFGDMGAFATWQMSVSQLAGASVAGTVTRSLTVGAALQQAMKTGANPLTALQALLPDIVVLANGPISAVKTVENGGFDVSQVIVAQADGSAVTVMAVNENLLAWSSANSQPLAAAPDALAWMTLAGQPLSNADITSSSIGTQVYLLGIPAAAILRTPSLAANFAAELAQIGFLGEAPQLATGAGVRR